MEETFESESFSKEDLANGEEENQAPDVNEHESDSDSDDRQQITNEQAKEQLEESGIKESEELAERIEESVNEEDLSKQIDIAQFSSKERVVF